MLVEFKKIHEYVHNMKNELRIFLVSNVRETTRDYTDYNKTSVDSEFLTLQQQNTIHDTLQKSDFDVACFSDEQDFINRYILDYHEKQEKKYNLVINMAQKGIATGRKSLIPAFCDLYGLWHTNSDPYIVSLMRNKYHCGTILRLHGLPTPDDCLYLPEEGWLMGKSPQKGRKVIAKLNHESSSIGLNEENVFAYSPERDDFIKELANEFKQPVILQNFIEGCEVEVPIIALNKAEVILPVGISLNNERELGDKILNYDIRRNLKFGFYNLKEKSTDLAKSIEHYAIQAVKLFGITGFGRVDFRIDANNNPYIIDIATSPHLTEGMSFYYAFSQNGLVYSQMLETLIAISVMKYKQISLP